MDQCSTGRSCSDFDGERERADGEEKCRHSQMFLDVNGRTLSTSSSNSSLTNCSLNESISDNGDLLEDNVNRYGESKEGVASQRKLLAVNAPEKIIFCVDICEDEDATPFKLADGTTYKPLYMIKRVIKIFVHNKQLLNKKHEFALMLLQSEKVLWLRNLTREAREVLCVLDDLLEVSGEPMDVFDLCEVFNEVHKQVTVPEAEPATLARPPYTVRLILFYSRAHCLPDLLSDQSRARQLLSSEFFTIDIVYVHEESSQHNRCEEIFNRLSALDEKGYSYVFAVARNATKLHNSTAKLLAHPLQRPLQRRARYVLPEPQPEGD